MKNEKLKVNSTRIMIGMIILIMILSITCVYYLLIHTPVKSEKEVLSHHSQTVSDTASLNNSGDQGSKINSENLFPSPTKQEQLSGEESSMPEKKPIDVNKVVVNDYLTYNMDTFITPYWEGNVVYNETLMFVQDEKGNVAPAPLLYKPLKILSVRSFNLKREYKPGVDYTVENGNIKLTPGSGIYSWPYHRYYPEKNMPGTTYKKTGGGYVSYGEYNTFFKTQVAVTYIHNDTWRGEKPVYKGNKLPVTLDKLKNRKEIKILFYGDSITTGCNASGWNQINAAPYVPIFTDIVIEKLKKSYNNNEIKQFNTAVGGKDSYWGIQNVEKSVNDYKPDLVFIAFGANDGIRDYHVSCDLFKENIKKIMDAIRSKNPKAEFILVSTLIPNMEADGFCENQESYEAVLQELEEENTGTIVAPMTSIHKYLLTKKRFYDMTGNNINHPNDFLIRCYAQTICKLLVENFK